MIEKLFELAETAVAWFAPVAVWTVTVNEDHFYIVFIGAPTLVLTREQVTLSQPLDDLVLVARIRSHLIKQGVPR